MDQPTNPNRKLTELGIVLPRPAAAEGIYVPAVRSGNVVRTSGQIPTERGELIAVGKVPDEVSPEEARHAARVALINALAAIQALTGSIESVRRVLRLNVLVNSRPDFTDQPEVANGASELLVELFGPAGRHTRTAVGAVALPCNAAVELDLTVELD
jgi:enamine deaminase RidA (YjgF/YER057c/UK114 family)